MNRIKTLSRKTLILILNILSVLVNWPFDFLCALCVSVVKA